jgi:serine/threonine protein kinase
MATNAGGKDEQDDRAIALTELSIIEEIGQGTTATVYRGKLRGTVVAVKEIHILNDDTDMAIIQAAQRELRVLSKCSHPNIVHFVGLVVESFPIRLVLEYCAGGSLFDLLHNYLDVDICWDQRFKVLHDTASAEDYLHNFEPPIIHRDLKSLNLMLLEPVTDSNTLPHVKLADFGFARLEAAHMTSCVGTKHWMAPEVLESNTYTTKADVFSFAMLAYEVAFRAVPFCTLDAHEVARKTRQGIRPSFDEPDEQAPNDVTEMIALCWEQDPEMRPDFNYIKNAVAQAALRARSAGSTTL